MFFYSSKKDFMLQKLFFRGLFDLPCSGSWTTCPVDPDSKDWVYSVSKVCFCRKKAIEPLDTMFNCPFCNHEKSCEVLFVHYSHTLLYMTGEDLSNCKKSASQQVHKSATNDGPFLLISKTNHRFQVFLLLGETGL